MSQTAPEVRLCSQPAASGLGSLLARYGMLIEWVTDDAPIPGSHWGEPEAGLIGNRLYLRSDTPIHSALHEACHYICMDADRRAHLHTDAGGDYAEEDGVCYLQILLAGELPKFGRDGMLADMDAWGYSFRLGSARAWFENDAENAEEWLRGQGLVDSETQPNGQLRI